MNDEKQNDGNDLTNAAEDLDDSIIIHHNSVPVSISQELPTGKIPSGDEHDIFGTPVDGASIMSPQNGIEFTGATLPNPVVARNKKIDLQKFLRFRKISMQGNKDKLIKR